MSKPNNGKEWEYCNYAKDKNTKDKLINEYKIAYRAGWEFKSILLPKKYWGCNECQNSN